MFNQKKLFSLSAGIILTSSPAIAGPWMLGAPSNVTQQSNVLGEEAPQYVISDEEVLALVKGVGRASSVSVYRASSFGGSSQPELNIEPNSVHETVGKGLAVSNFGGVFHYLAVSRSVASNGSDPGSNSVEFYDKWYAGGQWNQTAVLNDPQNDPDSGFGESIAMGVYKKGYFLFVGAPRARVNGVRSGRVYVYLKSSRGGDPVPWTVVGVDTGTLPNTQGNIIEDGTPGSLFGASLSVDYDPSLGEFVLAASAPCGPRSNSGTREYGGSVFTYVLNGNALGGLANLSAERGNSGGYLGLGGHSSKSIAFDGRTLVAANRGSMMVFERSDSSIADWNRLELSGPEEGASSKFGSDIALDDNFIMTGDPRSQESGRSGRLHTFGRSLEGWRALEDPSSGISEAENTGRATSFGTSVALSNGKALVTLPGYDSPERTDAGGVLSIPLSSLCFFRYQVEVEGEGIAKDEFRKFGRLTSPVSGSFENQHSNIHSETLGLSQTRNLKVAPWRFAEEVLNLNLNSLDGRGAVTKIFDGGKIIDTKGTTSITNDEDITPETSPGVRILNWPGIELTATRNGFRATSTADEDDTLEIALDPVQGSVPQIRFVAIFSNPILPVNEDYRDALGEQDHYRLTGAGLNQTSMIRFHWPSLRTQAGGSFMLPEVEAKWTTSTSGSTGWFAINTVPQYGGVEFVTLQTRSGPPLRMDGNFAYRGVSGNKIADHWKPAYFSAYAPHLHTNTQIRYSTREEFLQHLNGSRRDWQMIDFLNQQ